MALGYPHINESNVNICLFLLLRELFVTKKFINFDSILIKLLL